MLADYDNDLHSVSALCESCLFRRKCGKVTIDVNSVVMLNLLCIMSQLGFEMICTLEVQLKHEVAN